MNKKTVFYMLGYVVVLVVAVSCCLIFLKQKPQISVPDETTTSEPNQTIDVFVPIESLENTAELEITPTTQTSVPTVLPNTASEPTLTAEPTVTAEPVKTDEPAVTVEPTPTITPELTATPSITLTPQPVETEEDDKKNVTVTVYLTKKDEYVQMDMEEYVTGVLTGEMSYSKNIEALKAQAVVVRSYYLKRTTYKFSEHEFSPVCDDPEHCMTYTSYEDYIALIGKELGDKTWQIYKNAALACEGEYLTYNGEYIDAMCHSSSYKTTENSLNVYGTSHPYLTAVSTPEKAPVSVVEIGTSEILAKLFDEINIEDAKSPLGEIKRTEDSDRVSFVTIFGVEFTARQLRKALGLSSTCFTLTYENNRFIFTCYGQGHGLGLSQHGAYVFADMGVDYRGIVLHYFSGCEIQSEIIEKNNE